MLVCRAWIPGYGTYFVSNSGEPRNPTVGTLGIIRKQPKDWTADDLERIEGGSSEKAPIDVQTEVAVPQVTNFLNVGSLANISVLHPGDDADGKWHAQGDATEIAIHVFVTRFGRNRTALTSGSNGKWRQVAEFPFDSAVKKMTAIYEGPNGEQWSFTKGATERVILSCTSACIGDEIIPLPPDSPVREEIQTNLDTLARDGLRVLSFASKTESDRYDENDRLPLPKTEAERKRKKMLLEQNPELCECHEVPKATACSWRRELFESDLVFRGLIGIYDPPRPESRGAVKKCHEAGIAVHMLTGDHPSTARAIAQQIGILPTCLELISALRQESMVMTGPQFDGLSEEQVDKLPVLPLVIARCSPATKVNMIEALHRRKGFVAMTGDGVNDSPALRKADVGIAMGTGSDVAKESADIVLVDDNFNSILNAIEEGRRMFDNIQRFVCHVLAENCAQAIVLLVGLVIKDEDNKSVFPLSPFMILFVILITSGLPDMGLGREKAATGIMSRPPHDSKRSIFSNTLILDTLFYGVVTSALSFLSYFITLKYGYDMNIGTGCNDSWSESCEPVFRSRTTGFVSLTWCALFLAWQLVSMDRSFFRMRSKPENPFTQPFKDVWSNQLLFWAILVGILSIFLVVYIPELNRNLFRGSPISWEWGIVISAAALFFGLVESWKYGKRRWLRNHQRKKARGSSMADNSSDDIEPQQFDRCSSIPGFSTEKMKS